MISEKEKFFDPRKPFASKRPETHEEWQARMGGEVLAVVRSGLYLDFRFLDMALSALTPVPDERCGVLATDGVNLYYQPSALLRLYQENPKYLNRLYLHMYDSGFCNRFAMEIQREATGIRKKPTETGKTRSVW